ncbi:M56 family metallopeptidase [Bradyrhizobium sp. ARR65]|uniref:M56 family metallopeptidase n=1 Tax=Bradyrhizobium sp. ARR65 TaxID=1040989 RepID=UPI00046358AB|nr:M56 family metallopeptidase [Bradyrhizobium sp. ARR65]
MLTILAEAALRSFLLGSIVWTCLTLFRVRNPHLQMTSWTIVLFASLAMPLLMRWTVVTVTVGALPVPTTEHFWPIETSPPELLQGALSSESSPPAAVPVAQHQRIDWLAANWQAIAMAVYAGVAGLLLLRLALGLHLTWRLARAARPIDEPGFGNVRISPAIDGPVTFGSTILVPSQFDDWDFRKREAVLAHEGAHIANRDFYILLLASLNRALFWFSPFAWWQLTRLAELAEIISDAEAIEVLEDRLSYAEILLDLVQNIGRIKPAGLEMARASTIRTRIERIVAAVAVPPRAAWRQRLWIAVAIVPVAVASSGSIADRAPEPPAFTAGRPDDRGTVPDNPERADFYAFGPRSVLAIFREGDDLFGQLTGQRKLHLTQTSDGNYSYPATGGPITFAVDAGQSAELTLHQNGHDVHAARIVAMRRASAEMSTTLLDQYVGWYELAPNRALAVTRDGNGLHIQETGRTRVELTTDGPDAFFSGDGDLVVFLRDDQGQVPKLLLSDQISGARLAPRIDQARARIVEGEFARRMTEVPDRFRAQTPTPGVKEVILRGIADMQNGTPNYDRMSATLAAAIRRQAAQLHEVFVSLGAVESIFFRGVGPGGYDIYGVKFANGSAEFRVLLGPDGKAEDVLFRPNGNDEPGDVLACSGQPNLKAQAGNAPIKIQLFNSTGDDIQLYSLDAKGARTTHGTIADDRSAAFLTTVDSTWVVTDRSGQCLEIVLPGQRTRYHVVEASRGEPEHVERRTAPLAGSEEMLRDYIQGLDRGQPNYDRMTAEVAAETRQQLPFDRAILAKLGELRALSFRGVTLIGSDVYIAHFANGSVEWRIGLAKDGSIGRITLGPSY